MHSSLSRLVGLCLGLAVLFSATAQASNFSSLEERMSVAQFRAAGLDKLTPEELAALNAWLQGTATGASAPVGSAPPSGDRIGFRESESGGAVTSRYVGEFTGWSGKTRFRLENGQVWEQSESGNLRGVRLDNPMMTVKQGLFGSWHISVDGLRATTRVRRAE